MTDYKKVQFISWEIYTGPNQSNHTYSGLRSSNTSDNRLDVAAQCRDIDARIAFTSKAVEAAHKKAESSSSVLKIFMGPEFLYRGAGGAYLHDLLNGWDGSAPTEYNLKSPHNKKWPGLFGGLQNLVVNSKYENWLFIFGTAISASFSTKKAGGSYVIDASKPAEIYNTALAQLGGSTAKEKNYASRKHYKSHIDFIKWVQGRKTDFLDNVVPLEPEQVIPADEPGVREGGAVFRIPGVNDPKGKPIDFGIEVCLDHATSGGNRKNRWGRIRTANQWVKIQLVPSGGMDLVEASIRLQPSGSKPTPNSYAFNCDGLGSLNNRYGCHTQVWNGANGAKVQPGNKLCEASNGAPLAGTDVVGVPEPTGNVTGDQLWNNGSTQKGPGAVRVLKPVAL